MLAVSNVLQGKSCGELDPKELTLGTLGTVMDGRSVDDDVFKYIFGVPASQLHIIVLDPRMFNGGV